MSEYIRQRFAQEEAEVMEMLAKAHPKTLKRRELKPKHQRAVKRLAEQGKAIEWDSASTWGSRRLVYTLAKGE